MTVVERDYGFGHEDEETAATGLCLWCRENEALPDDDLCGDCALEFDGEPEEEQ